MKTAYHGVFAQIGKSVIVPLDVSEFLKSSLVLFPIKKKKSATKTRVKTFQNNY